MPEICFVLGCPGAGKSTICGSVRAEYVQHLSVGNYLREISDKPPVDTGDIDIKLYLRERRLLPAETIVALLSHKIDALQKDGCRLVLIDGFPRDTASADLFIEKVGCPRVTVVFECDPDVALARFLKRRRDVDDNENVFVDRTCEYKRNEEDITNILANRSRENSEQKLTPPPEFIRRIASDRSKELVFVDFMRTLQKVFSDVFDPKVKPGSAESVHGSLSTDGAD